MKIIKAGEVIADIPNKPQNFDGGCNGSTVVIDVAGRDVALATYANFEKACKVSDALKKAYLRGTKEFILPDD